MIQSQKGLGPTIIGSEEWCEFSQLGIPAILARIDSGAKTSSIQATNIKLLRRNDEDWVSFVVHPLKRNSSISVTCSAKLVDKRSIKSSIGISEERLIINTSITIGKESFDIELSLANRSTMAFKMLLGREAMANRYLINPAQKCLQNAYTKKELLEKYKSRPST